MAIPDEDEFVKAILKANRDAGEPAWQVPKLVVIRGYVGHVDEGGPKKVRVFLNHALTDYYEIQDNDDIVYWEAVDEGPVRGTRVWLRHGAEIRLVRTRAEEAEVPRLLEGPIAGANLASAPRAASRWVAPTEGAVPRAGIDWVPYDDGGYEQTTCARGCKSSSP